MLRGHQKVIVDGVGEGEITSGTLPRPWVTPSARVPRATGSCAKVEIRGKLLDVRVVKPRRTQRPVRHRISITLNPEDIPMSNIRRSALRRQPRVDPSGSRWHRDRWYHRPCAGPAGRCGFCRVPRGRSKSLPVKRRWSSRSRPLPTSTRRSVAKSSPSMTPWLTSSWSTAHRTVRLGSSRQADTVPN